VTYIIPSIIAGILLSIPALAYISSILNEQLGFSISIFPGTNAILFGSAIGATVPLIASIYPIYLTL